MPRGQIVKWRSTCRGHRVIWWLSGRWQADRFREAKVEKFPGLQYPLNRCDQKKRGMVFTPVMKFSYYSGSLYWGGSGFDALSAHEKGHTIRGLWESERGEEGQGSPTSQPDFFLFVVCVCVCVLECVFLGMGQHGHFTQPNHDSPLLSECRPTVQAHTSQLPQHTLSHTHDSPTLCLLFPFSLPIYCRVSPTDTLATY